MPARYSWTLVLNDLDWFMNNANGKKIYLSEARTLLFHRTVVN